MEEQEELEEEGEMTEEESRHLEQLEEEEEEGRGLAEAESLRTEINQIESRLKQKEVERNETRLAHFSILKEDERKARENPNWLFRELQENPLYLDSLVNLADYFTAQGDKISALMVNEHADRMRALLTPVEKARGENYKEKKELALHDVKEHLELSSFNPNLFEHNVRKNKEYPRVLLALAEELAKEKDFESANLVLDLYKRAKSVPPASLTPPGLPKEFSFSETQERSLFQRLKNKLYGRLLAKEEEPGYHTAEEGSDEELLAFDPWEKEEQEFQPASEDGAETYENAVRFLKSLQRKAPMTPQQLQATSESVIRNLDYFISSYRNQNNIDLLNELKADIEVERDWLQAQQDEEIAELTEELEGMKLNEKSRREINQIRKEMPAHLREELEALGKLPPEQQQALLKDIGENLVRELVSFLKRSAWETTKALTLPVILTGLLATTPGIVGIPALVSYLTFVGTQSIFSTAQMGAVAYGAVFGMQVYNSGWDIPKMDIELPFFDIPQPIMDWAGKLPIAEIDLNEEAGIEPLELAPAETYGERTLKWMRENTPGMKEYLKGKSAKDLFPDFSHVTYRGVPSEWELWGQERAANRPYLQKVLNIFR